ncbi:ClpXP protease specificity-enhancing factor [Actimicrobium sp. CCI2.3]|uniref:ClpXP protease specificity-enhancing factor n=1 Tax=Actimicrobium sp. CCI2.3 TaxID=3048616 RepID=UPI002AB573CB|nr:ClpXP protease specificity-enhancing factor [Actimicrobium sp. CCI2.3]MDY7573391.1 ClpXP protease specificity-enhancing factor [Actimicrobium sp. CCI2.3]MEB0021789.1 ClpXP protease specificity-enhancing factor [Actimicrobium sp. CCI2.3]
MPESSTKPYLLRAIYEWCTDNGYTPYLAVLVDASTKVPMQFVKNGEIVLNISFDATSALKMDNDLVRFSARFGGVSRDISVPVENIIAIYARENGQGMAFEVSRFPARDSDAGGASASSEAALVTEPTSIAPTLTSVPQASQEPGENSGNEDDPQPQPPKKGGRPTLTRIK